jgi:hypothetical protein
MVFTNRLGDKGLAMASEHAPLNCRKCPAFCCRMAGYVEVSRRDIQRLAKHLGITVRQFEEKHLVEVTRKGEKLIKQDFMSCQFLGDDRRCTVYKARPKDCREYICWDQDDETVYGYAAFMQHSVTKLRKAEKAQKARDER